MDGSGLAPVDFSRVASNAIPLRELLLSTAFGKTTEECFAFFLCRKTRHAFQWMMNLKRGSSWFENRPIYQGPRGGNAPMASENMDIFSCLQTRDLPCGGRMDSKNYQYGGSSYRFPRLNKEDLLGIRAKYGESARILELKPYHPDCCCTQSFQLWWDHCLGRYGALNDAYQRVFKNCPFRRELKGEDMRILLEQIAEDNRLSLTVSANYQSFCTPSQLALLGQGSAGGLKTPIFVQRRQKEKAPIPLASQAGSDVPSSSPQGVRVAAKKRSLPEEFGGGVKEQVQPKAVSSKQAKASPVEVPGVASVGL
ncbi:hypothetical protein Pyn_14955 [Prunus yedoensis var. nudiflora]|uniref:Uncharacterized protein n=1 Tax=Prunus yedoensis var. nudiflora TaxID=2094558 RepID=A0A314ZGP3_PRUYE|nr:hypothetical protein Pyn_14955 [Prunus yedoensis var. nudiflora]